MVAITTQEEFDARISERLKRERETLAKRYEEKYAGYVARDAHEQAVAELNDQLAAARQAAEESKASFSYNLDFNCFWVFCCCSG